MSISRSSSTCLTFPPPKSPETPSMDASEFEIVGDSAVMGRLRLQVLRIGPHFRTVLVSGEAGTGKEMVAHALHGMSNGTGGPFVACRVAELKKAFASGESFGNLVKKARGGTLFLDEVSEMSSREQLQLVQVLRQHELAQSRMESQRMDLRLIASTMQDLRILASAGRFSQELYQRLTTVEITLPPLRERMEDIPELAAYLLKRSAAPCGGSCYRISKEAVERLQGYHWPGNVRELESVLRSSTLQHGGRSLESYHLPELKSASSTVSAMPRAAESPRLQDVIERHVLQVLKDCKGNKLRAAEVLGISRSTLYRMLDTRSAPV
jgi:DNA-binding NtrC family response regulator